MADNANNAGIVFHVVRGGERRRFWFGYYEEIAGSDCPEFRLAVHEAQQTLEEMGGDWTLDPMTLSVESVEPTDGSLWPGQCVLRHRLRRSWAVARRLDCLKRDELTRLLDRQLESHLEKVVFGEPLKQG